MLPHFSSLASQVGVCVSCMLTFKYSWGLDLIIKTMEVAHGPIPIFTH